AKITKKHPERHFCHPHANLQLFAFLRNLRNLRIMRFKRKTSAKGQQLWPILLVAHRAVPEAPQCATLPSLGQALSSSYMALRGEQNSNSAVRLQCQRWQHARSGAVGHSSLFASSDGGYSQIACTCTKKSR